jgi:hypothetical protein
LEAAHAALVANGVDAQAIPLPIFSERVTDLVLHLQNNNNDNNETHPAEKVAGSSSSSSSSNNKNNNGGNGWLHCAEYEHQAGFLSAPRTGARKFSFSLVPGGAKDPLFGPSRKRRNVAMELLRSAVGRGTTTSGSSSGSSSTTSNASSSSSSSAPSTTTGSGSAEGVGSAGGSGSEKSSSAGGSGTGKQPHTKTPEFQVLADSMRHFVNTYIRY